MRILHIITRLILGGAQQNTVMTCAAQVKAGHQVWLAHGPIYGPEGSLLDEARASGATLIEVASMRRAVLPWHDVKSYFDLCRLIRDIKPDVVHTHSSKAGITGRAAAWKAKVPAIIHTVHGLSFNPRQSRPVYNAYVALERWAAKRCNHLIAITPAMVDAFVEHGIAPREKFTVIPSGIDLNFFRPRPESRAAMRKQYGIATDAPVVGLVGRLDPLKGHEDLLEIFDIVAHRLPALRMIFVGDGWNRSVIEQHPHVRAGRVVLTGLVPLSRVPEVLSAIDLVALPSYQEGQSRVLAEALLCGCGIVAYDTGGIGSVCIDGQTGRLVPGGDRNALARAILDMLEHPEDRRRLIEQGQQHVRDSFDVRRMVTMIEKVYEETLSRKRR